MFIVPVNQVNQIRTVIVTSNVNNYNVLTVLGSPVLTNPINILLKINTGVNVGGNTEGVGSCIFDSVPNGSSLKIINDGRIQGKGGRGGYAYVTGGEPGVAGDDAIVTSNDIIIDNTNGEIYGGGGGGGGSGSAEYSDTIGCDPDGSGVVRGGAGGGGAGSSPGAGGNLFEPAVNPGSAGTTEAGGAGGVGDYVEATAGGCFAQGGHGGVGGGPGQAGGEATQSVSWETSSGYTYKPNGAPGAAGKAVELNGNSVIWTGGNNGTQVKGAVS